MQHSERSQHDKPMSATPRSVHNDKHSQNLQRTLH